MKSATWRIATASLRRAHRLDKDASSFSRIGVNDDTEPAIFERTAENFMLASQQAERFHAARVVM